MKRKFLLQVSFILGCLFTNAQINGGNAPGKPLDKSQEMKIQPANVLYSCLSVNVAERFWINYHIKIFEQFPDYPVLVLTGDDKADYEKYRNATQEYLFQHKELYELIKKAESKNESQSPK
jgi:hypothetical protein